MSDKSKCVRCGTPRKDELGHDTKDAWWCSDDCFTGPPPNIMVCRVCKYILNEKEIKALASHFLSSGVCKQRCYELLFVPNDVDNEIPVTEEELAAGGTRADRGKPRVDLIPAEVLLEIARIYTHGAEKYSEHNWSRGMNYSRMYSSLQRHLLKFWAGETNDPDSGEHHLTCVAFGVLGLLYFELHRDAYHAFDDRYLGNIEPERAVDPSTRMVWAYMPSVTYLRVGTICMKCRWLTDKQNLAQCANCDANGSLTEVFQRLEVEDNER